MQSCVIRASSTGTMDDNATYNNSVVNCDDYLAGFDAELLRAVNTCDEVLYVTGHRVPDVDSLVSTLLCCELFQYLGYNVVPIVLEELDHVTAKVMYEFLSVERFHVQSLSDADIMKHTWVLLDHNDPVDSIAPHGSSLKVRREGTLPSADAVRVCAVIDHHVDLHAYADVKLINTRGGCTAELLMCLMKRLNFPITRRHVNMALHALSIDTCGLLSDRTTSGAIRQYEIWANVLDLSKAELVKRTFFQTDFLQPADRLLMNGYKEHRFGTTEQYSAASCYVEITHDDETVRRALTDMDAVAAAKYNTDSSRIEFFFIIVNSYEANCTSVQFYGRLAQKHIDILQPMMLPGIRSRGSTIVPMLRKLLNIT